MSNEQGKPDKYIRYSSHIPVLIKMMSMIEGDVLEIGAGFFSTPIIHWMSHQRDAIVQTYDKNPSFHKLIKNFENDFHKITLVEDWDKIDIENNKWDLVFIDHERERRAIEAIRVANCAKFVIIHDSDWRSNKHYNWEEVYKHYKYRKKYNGAEPKTSVLSNFVDVSKIDIA